MHTFMFFKMQIPKECYEPETKGRVEDLRKRKLEPDGMVENLMDNRPTKTRCLGMDMDPKSVEMTKFGGTFTNMGAKSKTWREATSGLLGAMVWDSITGIKKDESGKTPVGLQTGGIDTNKYSL